MEENEKLKKHLEIPKTCNLKTLEDYKSYYENCTKKQTLEDTYIDYCAYVNLVHNKTGYDRGFEEMNKQTYLKLPNITIAQLQDVVDYLEKINIKYIEYYEEEHKLEQALDEIEKYINETLNLKEEYPEEVECVVNDILQIIKKVKGE